MITKINILLYLTTIATSVLLIACTSNIDTDYNDEFDFTQVKSYGIFPRESKFTELQRMSDFQRNRIELAIENQMDGQDFEYKNFEQADVIVTYFLVGNSLGDLQKYNKGVMACLACSQKEQASLNAGIRRSMLVIDILDSDKKRSVFRGFIKVDIKEKNTSEENQAETVQAVKQILSQFPPKQ
ncbi:hypothetical protein A9Q98_07185 [Thalassotalea sp. 42_200_T64]|nr:hypothetical protein A9Q98_07185 [Thalassotalea sp. 42_200_T64]